MLDATYIGNGRRSGRTTKLVALATFYAEANPDTTILFLSFNYQEGERVLRMLQDSAHATVRIERNVSRSRHDVRYSNGSLVRIFSASNAMDLDHAARGWQPKAILVDNVEMFPRSVQDNLWDILAPLDAPIWYTDNWWPDWDSCPEGWSAW